MFCCWGYDGDYYDCRKIYSTATTIKYILQTHKIYNQNVMFEKAFNFNGH